MQESEISKTDWFKNHRVESHKQRHRDAPTSQHSSKLSQQIQTRTKLLLSINTRSTYKITPAKKPTFLSEITDIYIYMK